MDNDFNVDLDKLTLNELSLNLRQTIVSNTNHTKDKSIHVTQEEKDSWNNILSMNTASSAMNGLMSKEDKSKLDDIEAGANKYIHPRQRIAPGQYLSVVVDEYGHVVAGGNPSLINITAANAERLGGISYFDYARNRSPFFTGKPNTPTPDDDALSTAIVNIEYLNRRLEEFVNTGVSIPSKRIVKINDDGHIVAGELEMWVEDLPDKKPGE